MRAGDFPPPATPHPRSPRLSAAGGMARQDMVAGAGALQDRRARRAAAFTFESLSTILPCARNDCRPSCHMTRVQRQRRNCLPLSSEAGFWQALATTLLGPIGRSGWRSKCQLSATQEPQHSTRTPGLCAGPPAPRARLR